MRARTAIEYGRRLSRRVLRDERAATMVEYALMLALIAIICFVAVQVLGTSASSGFANPDLNDALKGS
jgi:Flp pilus assembly pilin Flp